MRSQSFVDALAFSRGEFFRIVHLLRRKICGQDHGGGNHRTGERAASRLVDSRDQKKTASAQGTLAGEIAGHGAAFG